MSWLLAAPLLIPFGMAALALLAEKQNVRPRWISLFGAILHLGAVLALTYRVLSDGILAAHMGGWLAPVGIVLVADAFSVLMLAAGSLVGLAVAIYALASWQR